MTAVVLRRLQKALGWSLLALLVILLLLLLVATWVVQTDSGSRWAIATARDYLPAELQLGSVSGQLASPLTLHNVRFESAGVRLLVDELTVHWRLFDLLDRAVTIEQLRVQGLALALESAPTQSSAKEPLALPWLPFSIELQQLAARDIRIVPAPAVEPIVITELDAAASWNHEQLALHQLRIRAPQADIDGAVALGFPAGLRVPAALGGGTMGVAELSASQLQLDLEYQLRIAGLAPITGSIAGSGPLAELQLRWLAAAPYGFELAGTVAQLLEVPKADLTFSADTAALASINPLWPAVLLGVRGTIAGSATELTLALNGNSAALAGPAAPGNGQGVVELVYSPERLRIVTASFREMLDGAANEAQPAILQVQPLVLRAKGLVELNGPAPQLDVGMQWQHLRWPLDQNPQLQSARGELTLLGTTAEYQLQLDAQLAVLDQTDGVLQARGQGSPTAFNLRSFDMTALGGTAAASGNVSWDEGVNAAAQWSFSDLNPGVLLPDWPGAVAAQGSVTVRQAHDAAPMAIAIKEAALGGVLRDAALTGAIDLDYQAPRLVIKQAQLGLGTNRLQVAGGIDAQGRYDLQFELAASALDLLIPGSKGAVTAEGVVSGDQSAPVLQTIASARDMQVEQLRLGSLALTADVGVAPSHNNQIELKLAQLLYSELPASRVSVQLRGPQTGHELSLGLQSDDAKLALVLNGATTDLRRLAEPDGSYGFVVQQLDLERAEQPPWQLDRGDEVLPEGQLAAESAVLERLCLRSADSRACFAGRWLGGSNVQGQLMLENLSLAHFNNLLPPELALAGRLNGGGSIGLQGHQPQADLKLTTSAIDLLSTKVGDDGAEVDLIRFAPGGLQLTGSDSTALQLLLDLPLDTAAGASAGGLQAQVTLTPGAASFGQSALTGAITARVADLSGVAALIPEVSQLVGSLDSAVELAGTVDAPLATGHLRMKDGAVALIGPDITVRQIDLDLSADLDAAVAADAPVPLQLRGSMVSGGGTLTVAGDLRYSSAELAGTIALAGERFRLLNNDQAELYMSPDLAITLADQAIQVRGVVAVPEADITLKSLPESAVVVSDDQVLVGTESADTARSPYTYDAQVTLSLGDQVHFEGFGLDADFAGDLRITQVSGEPGLGRGEIRITEGRYQAYGQDLAIETGRALWTSSVLSQPGIDLRAIRKPRPDVVVGVRARGRLSQPDFSLFSEPTLSDSDQLSYLVLGRPLEDNSSAESSLVSQAALALGIRGGNFLSDQFGDKLGVDRIGVETEAGAGTSGAAFVVGKYLSPKLYVSYGLGLLDSVSTLKLEYLLSSKWRLVSQSSTLDSGGDLIYTIERK